MKNLKLFALISSAVMIFSSCTQQTEHQALDLAPDEAESKIAALETQVSELQSQVSNIEDVVDVPTNEVKITYEELFAIAKDIFEKTVDTDLECVEDADFGVPEDIDKTGFISATYRTNDNDVSPMYFVTIFYDAVNVYPKIKETSISKITNYEENGTENRYRWLWKTSNGTLTQDLFSNYYLENIYPYGLD